MEPKANLTTSQLVTRIEQNSERIADLVESLDQGIIGMAKEPNTGGSKPRPFGLNDRLSVVLDDCMRIEERLRVVSASFFEPAPEALPAASFLSSGYVAVGR